MVFGSLLVIVGMVLVYDVYDVFQDRQRWFDMRVVQRWYSGAG